MRSGTSPSSRTPDPSGFFLKGLFKAVGRVVKVAWRPVLAIAAVALMQEWLLPALIPGLSTLGTMGSVISGALSGVVSSAIASGFDLRSMAIGAISGGVAGELSDFAGELIGEAVNAGGGFWSGAAPGLADAAVGRLADKFTRTVAKASLSGTNGANGIFTNGGATLAFEYATGGKHDDGLVPVGGVLDDIWADLRDTPRRIGDDLARVYRDVADDPWGATGKVLGSVPVLKAGVGAGAAARRTTTVYQSLNDTHEAFCRKRIAGTSAEVHQGLSWEQLRAFPDHTFDMVYLDADHRYWGIRQDLEAAAPKVKPGGVIVCDDYIIHDPIGNVECGVIPAVNEFIKARGYEGLGYTFGQWMFGNLAFRVH